MSPLPVYQAYYFQLSKLAIAITNALPFAPSDLGIHRGSSFKKTSPNMLQKSNARHKIKYSIFKQNREYCHCLKVVKVSLTGVI